MFKIGIVVIGQKFQDEMAYLNGAEGTVVGSPKTFHIHSKQGECYGDMVCQEVKWCDGSVHPYIPVMCLREKRPPANDTDTSWATDLLKKITQPEDALVH
jgi:hypothetical protein